MINTYVIQEFCKRADNMTGISVKKNSGTNRFIQYMLEKDDILVSQDDILDTIKYMIDNGYMIENGNYGNETLYAMVRKS